MCGRARIAAQHAQYAQALGIPLDAWRDADRYQPHHNLAPGGWMPVVRVNHVRYAEGDQERFGQNAEAIIQTMKWGLIPSFHKQGENFDFWRMFNARSETLHTSPVFRRLLPQKRCIVLLNGFYEWKLEAGGRKQPYYIYLPPGSESDSQQPTSPTSFHETGKDSTSTLPLGGKGASDQAQERLMVVAGLWDVTTGEDGLPLHTVTLVTCDSCSSLTWLHDRMPVLLDSFKEAEAWLGATLPKDCTLFGSRVQQQQPQQSHSDSQPSLVAAEGPESFVKSECLESSIHREGNTGTAVSQEQHADSSLMMTNDVKDEGGQGPGGEEVIRLIQKVCRPYTHKLSFHPVTQEMTKMAFNSPKACIDIRKAKGTISSFFALKTQQQQGSSTAKGAAADAGSGGGGGQQAGTPGVKRSQQGAADEQNKDSKRQAL